VTRICLSVLPVDDTLPNLIKRICAKKPDLIEYRLDYLTKSSALETIAENKRCPIIAADRSRRKQARGLLLCAAEIGFDIIDVDISCSFARSIIRQLKVLDVQVITSHHDSIRTPPETKLIRLLQTERKLGGDICKIVTTANRPIDNLVVLGFINKYSRTAKIVSFAMGKLGVTSRVLSPLFGAEFTFACIDNHSKTAEGQTSIDDLRQMWKKLEIA